ncbi:unnamed protein product [Rhizoctonia solani]|uniref:NACHT domain-containing protein n=1 Tax=Rhizoctonia solani TaxID=456999 RepID=A0A8H3A828_9AGAM|nr:unnamed protein product [Rhizoctonia solani]
MSSQSSGSKRKRPAQPMATLGNLLHPGGWRNKRAKSGSPSASGASTPGIGYSHSSAQSNPGSRSPSPMRNPEPQLIDQNPPNAPSCAPEASPNTARQASQPTAGIPASTQNLTGGAWAGLEKALQALCITTRIIPSLSKVVDDLTLLIPLFEATAKGRSDYDELATGLKSMVDLLIRYLDATIPEEALDPIEGITEAIRKEIESINMHQARSHSRRMLGSSDTEDDMIRRYRRVEQLFRQLQGEASMSTWSSVNELVVAKRLKSLRPAKLARFDSELSTEVSRRGCTKDTRTKILDDSLAWSENPDIAKIYWMNGMAGTGKTTIAYSLCGRLKARKQLAASFFCTRASPECREAKRIIPTIAYQLARRLTPFRHALCQQLKQDPDISTSQLTEQFDQLLKKPLLGAKDKLSNNLVIVVDALDECNDPHIVELFLDLLFRSARELPIKFFVTSRPEPAIRNKMMLESEHSRSILYLHEIEQSLVQADIELYLREELASISPADSDIQELAEHAGNLFIYAATAVRYIRPVGKVVNSKARLAAILAVNTESKQLSAIDVLYSAILAAAIDDPELEPIEQDQIRCVLWTAVCVYEPILIGTLSTLSGLNNKDDTMVALQPLRSVLHVSDSSELVTTLHASFPDYMLARERSGVFYCNRATHSQLLAEQCFKVMRTQLRFNMCSIQSSFIPDDEIAELGEQINANISSELSYTCRFWADHLTEANPNNTLLLLVHAFLSQQLLFWMEVMNLKKCLAIGVIGTTKLNTWLAQMTVETPTDLLELASDAHGFVASYAPNPTSVYTPHIYLSALPLSPPSSSVRLCYLPRFKGLIKVSGTIFEKLEKAALGTWASTSSIRSAGFSSNGDHIILGDDKGKISVRNAYDGKYLVQPFKAHKKVVTSIGVSSNGMQIVSGSHDMTLSIWNANDGSLIAGPFKGHTNRVTSVAFSPDAAYVVSGSDDCTIGIWNPHDAAVPMRAFAGHTKGVKSAAFSPDGSRIISGSLDHTIRLWDLSSGATILHLKGHTGAVSSVHLSLDGSHIISGSNDSTIRIWNVSDGSLSLPPLKGHSNRITSIAISPNGGRIVSGSLDRTIRVWDRHSGELVAGPFEGHLGSIWSVSFSGDGMRILSASDDKTVRVWSVQGKTQQVEKTLKGSLRHDYRPQFTSSFDQTYVAYFDQTKPTKFHVWNVQTITHVAISKASEIRSLRFSLDSTRIHSLHRSGTICTWDAQTGRLVDGPHRCSTANGIDRSTCSVDGTRVVTCYDRKTELWRVPLNRSIALHDTGFSYSSILSQDGSKFVIRTESGIQVWDADSGIHVAGPFSANTMCDFSPDGTYVCCGVWKNQPSLELINVNSGERIPMPQTQYDIRSAGFTPDGLYVTGTGGEPSGDGATICWIWNIRDRTFTSVTLQGNRDDGHILDLQFSDGWFLLSRTYMQDSHFYVGRFHIDSPAFIVNPDGWVRDCQHRPVLWVPTDIRNGFAGCTGFLISGDGVLLCIDYSGMLVGDDWCGCYIGDSQTVSLSN